MMKPVHRVDGRRASASRGKVVIDWPKTIWIGSNLTASLILAPFFFTSSALLAFAVLTYITLLIGHSVGMHRMMIHKTFSCSKFIERSLIYVGVLVGMGGPSTILRTHDMRDWAQRQDRCHDFFSHRQSLAVDLFWQLFCRFEFVRPPVLHVEPEFRNDRFYSFLDRTWRYHQLLLVLPLYYLGGWAWVVWCIPVRICTSIIGHWTITYFCHNPGPGHWTVRDAGVQASNIPGLGVLTYGECWHNNHHAFPESARIGLERGQCDPSWRFIQILKSLRMAYNIGLPRPADQCEDLIRRRQS